MSMRMNMRKMSAVGILSFGLALVGIGAGVFWMHGHHNESKGYSATEPDRSEAINALKVEIGELRGNSSDLERRSAEMNGELTSLRSQLAGLNQGQTSIDRIASADLENSEASAWDEEGATAELTPEEELEQVEAQTLAQIELFEETILAEQSDPEWSSWAELALDDAYRSEEMAGIKLVGAECRTTVCRMELSLDGSASPEETFRKLTELVPWQGEGFVRIDDGVEGESAQVVAYLAREGYSLPQYRE